MQKNIKRHKIKTLRSIHLVLFSIIILALINKFIKQFYVDKRKLDLLKVEFYKVFNLNPYGKSEKKVFFLYGTSYFAGAAHLYRNVCTNRPFRQSEAFSAALRTCAAQSLSGKQIPPSLQLVIRICCNIIPRLIPHAVP